MPYRPALIAGMLIPLAVAFIAAANAQPLGSFSWQLQPFCNVLTVSVTQQGNIYTLDGYDDQCGAPQRAPLVGTAGLNPDGTIGFGLHIITVPGGRGLNLEARIPLPSLNGSWSDSIGYSGTFGFNVRVGGNRYRRRRFPAPLWPVGSITPAQLAAAAVTTANVAGGSITPEKLSVSPPRLVSSGLTTGVIGLDRDQTVPFGPSAMAARIWKDLRDEGEQVSEKRVARLMRADGPTGTGPQAVQVDHDERARSADCGQRPRPASSTRPAAQSALGRRHHRVRHRQQRASSISPRSSTCTRGSSSAGR